MNTPIDIVRYVFENELESDFLNSLSYHIQNYSIAEILDRDYKESGNGFVLCSQSYSLNLDITDDDVLTALHNGLYVSSFISRHNNDYQIHFLVHKYPVSMKAKFDEQIMQEVLQYMVLKTVVALRLDTIQKVNEYINRS